MYILWLAALYIITCYCWYKNGQFKVELRYSKALAHYLDITPKTTPKGADEVVEMFILKYINLLDLLVNKDKLKEYAKLYKQKGASNGTARSTD